MKLPKRIQKSLKVIVINIVILAALLELGSVGVYFLQTGTFFYTEREKGTPETKSLEYTAQGQNVSKENIIRQLHPYFGFVQSNNLQFQFSYSKIAHLPNNFGFESPYNYPLKKQNKDQFIVGVFGGSVGQSISMFELENHILKNSLQQLTYFKNKEIIVLSFTAGSYKQPQQLLVLNYFLAMGQEFDLVINIDGFNEAALGFLNYRHGIDVSMPDQAVITPLVSLANKDVSLEELRLTLETMEDKGSMRDALASLKKCNLATCYLLSWVRVRYFAHKHYQALQKLDALRTAKEPGKWSLVKINGIDTPLDDSTACEKIASIWADASLTIKNTLKERDTPYFHFIQPNQYYQTNRKFTEAETKIALNHQSPYEEAVIKGYPPILSRLEFLKQSGVDVYSAVNLFDNTPDIVYEDNCCHYNQVGNELFLKYISKTITDALARNPRFASTPD
ncbi:MAG: hypothetical protein AABM67_04645 [Acidobacteriota bacterium]